MKGMSSHCRLYSVRSHTQMPYYTHYYQAHRCLITRITTKHTDARSATDANRPSVVDNTQYTHTHQSAHHMGPPYHHPPYTTPVTPIPDDDVVGGVEQRGVSPTPYQQYGGESDCN
eukprot:GHVR01157347.1.p1 GENE.GHVR01157347.1~~GHVR01157347.1.p1  ORF type:complete len:116 (+),score=18.85 GHVR01157347.1:345-692(+)